MVPSFSLKSDLIFINYFSEFIHQVAVKSMFTKALQKKCFNPTLCFDTKSKRLTKVMISIYLS